MSAAPLFGLVLAGGRSRRMRQDKAALHYGGKSQLVRAMELLAPRVARSFVSVRQDQLQDSARSAYINIVDLKPDLGPMGGIHAALHQYPDKAWLIVACDLPFLNDATLDHLIERRSAERVATAYRSSYDGLPEPLCAIFEPRGRELIDRWLGEAKQCPRAFLAQADTRLLDPIDAHALDNINTREEYVSAAAEVLARAAPEVPLRLTVRYFALLREQAGRSQEQLQTRARTPLELYEELQRRHGLALSPGSLRVAINEDFGDWGARLAEGDTVAFLPPVAGG